MSAFVVPFVVGLLVLAGLALDGGLALAAKSRAIGQAEAAARAGAQAIDLAIYRCCGILRIVPEVAAANARAHLAAEHITGTVVVSGDTVSVTVTTAQPTQLLGLVGIGSLSVDAQGHARPQHGVSAVGP